MPLSAPAWLLRGELDADKLPDDIGSTEGTSKLHFRWQERGGPLIKKPTRKGFGTVLLEHAIAGIDSAPTIDFSPAGLTYETETALSMLVPTGNHSPMAGSCPVANN